MSIRELFIAFCLLAGLLRVPSGASADTMVVGRIQADSSHNLVLKKIVEKIGNRLIALVIDPEGHEQHILITSEDAVELKRGLWVIRPGTYQIDI